MDQLNWDKHYTDDFLPWDIGYASGPLAHFITTLENKDQKILIPGAGLGWEAELLHHSGFTGVFVCDWAESALKAFHKRVSDFPVEHLIRGDFFKLDSQYDLILEQTFLSALNPEVWPEYVRKMHKLLSPKGMLAGVVFASPFFDSGPPFGAYKEEYIKLFSTHFNILEMVLSHHSIVPRKGNELFFRLTPKVI